MGSYRFTSAEREDMTLELAQELAMKAGFTKEERAELLNTARLLKLKTPTKASCANCWSDLAVQIVVKLRGEQPHEVPGADAPAKATTEAQEAATEAETDNQPTEAEKAAEAPAEGKKAKAKKEEPKLRLRPGTDVYFRGYRINAETIRTQEQLKKLIEWEFPAKYIITE